jgi:hypothetical protein
VAQLGSSDVSGGAAAVGGTADMLKKILGPKNF